MARSEPGRLGNCWCTCPRHPSCSTPVFDINTVIKAAPNSLRADLRLNAPHGFDALSDADGHHEARSIPIFYELPVEIREQAPLGIYALFENPRAPTTCITVPLPVS